MILSTQFSRWALTAFCAASVLGIAAASAENTLYYASAPMTPGGAISGDIVDADQLVGTRFNVDQSITISAFGAHVFGLNGNDRLFAALVHLDSFSDLPDSADLTSSDLLAVTTFIAPAVSQDLIIPIDPIAVSSGDYGVVIGSGLFGADGRGAIPFAGDASIGGSYFWRGGDQLWSDGALPPGRITVYVPEPATISMIALIGIAGCARRRSTT